MLTTQTLQAPGLTVAVRASDPVRRADLAARVALAGHRLAEDEQEAEVVLADADSPAPPELPVLRLAEPGEDGSSLPPFLSPAQLDAALRAVAVGLRVSLPAPVQGFEEAGPARPLLTPRELEILECLGEGMSNKAVARRLGISAHTVKFHLEAVFAKLGATSRAEAVAKGLRRRLIML
ncbi:MAG TPA: response regulator transcription factor [Acetobacteraceae bacterium]|nr:response regulator transcription factor [Acetobacteraceae bacterium]